MYIYYRLHVPRLTKKKKPKKSNSSVSPVKKAKSKLKTSCNKSNKHLSLDKILNLGRKIE